MKGDFTRSTFCKEKHYAGVRQQQGRVQLDADWNEQLDIQAHLDRTTRSDVIGSCGTPNSGKGFKIGARPIEVAPLHEVHFVNQSMGWAVGGKSTILATTDGGKTWTFQTTPKAVRNVALYGVHFVDKSIGWAVGGGIITPRPTEAIILFTKDGGKTWGPQKSGVKGVLHGVHFVNESNGWAVGDKGTILATKDGGKSWNPQESKVNVPLYGVHFVNEAVGWALGDKGTILATKNEGETWTSQKSGVIEVLHGVHFVDESIGWAVGGGIITPRPTEAIILFTKDGGKTWGPQKSGVKGALHGVHFVNESNGWAVGDKGTILATKDGGKSWIQWEPPLDDLSIALGHMYVDGILCELEEEVSYLNQPDYPDPPPLDPAEDRTDLVYLDVWQRHITTIEDPDIREAALGGPDTTTRAKTVWQVKLHKDVGEVNCEDEIQGWPPPHSGALLSTEVIPTPDSEHPCIIPPSGGYRGLENHLYRVEIHDGGDIDKASFKWSRDNGSVVFAIEDFVDGQPTNKIKVKSLGRDKVLTLSKDDWVEVLDDATELSEQPAGMLAKITKDPDETQGIITLSKEISGFDPSGHPKVRRWDQQGVAIPVKDTNGPIPLEESIKVQFLGNDFRTGDYWIFAARTSTGQIEQLDNAPPVGIKHHHCRLALLKWKDSGVAEITDCRKLFPPVTELTSLFYVSGDGQEGMPDPTQPTALVPLPQPLQVGVANRTGGKVRFQITKGNGRLQGSGSSVVVSTGADGIASCTWELDSTTQSQQVEACLLDESGSPVPLPVRFTANLSAASEVAYDPKDCPKMKDAKTVQAAIDQLCQMERGRSCAVTVGNGGQYEQLDKAIKALLQEGQNDICICMLPGNHKLDEDLIVKGPNINIRIGGCSAGSRISLSKHTLRFTGLGSLILRDVEIDTGEVPQPLECDQCGDVALESCHLMGVTDKGALLAIGEADRIHLENNVIEAYLKTSLDSPINVFKEADTEISKLFAIFDKKNFRHKANIVVERLARLNLAERKALAKKMQESVEKMGDKLSATERETYSKFVTLVSASKVDLKLLTKSMKDIRDVAIQVSPGTAIVMIDGDADTTFANNEVTGVITLYGMHGKTTLTDAELKILNSLLKQGKIRVSGLTGNLHVQKNRLTRMVIAEAIVQKIKELLEKKEGVLEGVCKRSFLTENSMGAGENQFLSQHLVLSSNAFGIVDKTNAGTTIADSAILIGNYAPGDNRLFNVSRAYQKAANLTINIIEP